MAAPWRVFSDEAPDLAQAVLRRFVSFRHHVLATLRADGSPRLSGVEARFVDGELWLGLMPESRKVADLRRDPRLALHVPPLDEEMALGDAKLAGLAAEMFDQPTLRRYVAATLDAEGRPPPEPFHLFRVDLVEAVLTTVGQPPDHLVVESWHPGRGLERTERY